MGAITRIETQLILTHAYKQVKNNGGTQASLAEEIGADHQRISEGLKLKWSLTPTQAKILVGKYGFPRRESGEYVVAEKVESIEMFKQHFKQTSTRRYTDRLITLFSSKDVQKYMFKMMSVSSNTTIEEAMSLVQEVITANEIQHWLEQSIEVIENAGNTRQPRLPSLPSSISEYFHTTSSFCDVSFILPLAYLVNILAPNFSLTQTKKSELKPVVNEFVLTGACVLDTYMHRLDPKVTNPMFQNDCHEALEMNVKHHFYNEVSCDLHRTFDLVSPDRFSCCTVQLYINEKLDYHLLIKLHHKHQDIPEKNDRIVVIPNLNRMSLFEDLNDLSLWLRNEDAQLNVLKYNLAREGAYIPGATVL